MGEPVGGLVERRYIIQTRLMLGDRAWPIELALANRDQMRFRMLLGRQALQADMVVLPSDAYLQPELDLSAYGAGTDREADDEVVLAAVDGEVARIYLTLAPGATETVRWGYVLAFVEDLYPVLEEK